MVVLDALEEWSFCKGMSRVFQQKLVSLGEFKAFEAGEYIFVEGMSSGEVYILSEGQVALETALPQHEPMRIQTVEPGELLGWSPLLGLGVMTASARALTPCSVLALDANRILALRDSDPPFVLEIMRRTAVTLARRLNSTRKALLQEFCNEVQEVS